MPSSLQAVAFGLETITAGSAGFNLAYFLYRLAGVKGETAPRTFALIALALVSLAALAQSLAFLLAPDPGEDAASLALRLPAVLGASLISMLLLRRLAEAFQREELSE